MTWRGVGLVFGGIVLGLVLAVAGLYALFATGTLQAAFQRYYLSNVSQNLTATTTPAQTPPPASFALSSTTVAVPKAYASQEYYVAINNVMFDYSNVVTAGDALATVLTSIQVQAASGSFEGLLDMVVRAKTLIGQEQGFNAQFAQHLTALTAANQSTKDAVTKSMTVELAARGVALQGALTAYFAATDGLLSGAVPTATQISDAQAKGSATITTATAFKAALQSLLDRFKAAAQGQ